MAPKSKDVKKTAPVPGSRSRALSETSMPGSFHNSDNENDANRTVIRTTDQDTEITPASTAEAPVPAKTLYPRVSSTSVAAEKPMAVDTNRDLQRALLTANRLRAERDQY